jgi:hypothetical protein
MALICPIYNTGNACDVHRNCLFLRNGGCAVVLGATLAEENAKAIKKLENQLSTIEHNLQVINNNIRR